MLVLALIFCGLVLFSIGGWGLERVRQWRSARFARQADQAFMEGRMPLADLLLSSGLAMTPDNLGMRVAKATLMMRSGRREEAVREWQWMLEHAEPKVAPAVLRSFAFQLIAAGWWPELTRLALQQLRESPTEPELWTLLACEAARLSGGKVDPAAVDIVFGAVERALVAGYAALAAGDTANARSALRQIDATTRSYSNALLAARLWLLLGDESQARRAFMLLGRTLAPDELATHELLFGSLHEQVALRTAQTLIRPGQTAAEWEGALTRLVVHGLGRPDPAVARELTARLRPHARLLSPAAVMAAWFYCGAAGDERGELFWRQPLESAAGATLPNLTINRPDVSILRILIGRVPLSLELIYSVMAATPAARPEAAPAAR